VANAAVTLGVVDEIKNLPDAIKSADVVLLSLPLGDMRATLKQIGPHLKDNAVVMDTAPIKSQMTQWAKEFIPAGRFYLGLVPAVTVEAFSDPDSGLKAARPDLFKNTIMVVDAPLGTPAEVEGVAFGFARILGAKPILADLVESDSLMALVHLLPQLTAAALIDATIDQTGWAEARKLAGSAFASVTRGAADYDDAPSLKSAALANRTAALHALDVLLASLNGLREEIANEDEQGLAERLGHAFEARQNWLDERAAALWLKEGGDAEEVRDFGEQMMQTIFGSRIIDRMKKKK
jgi:prephenate dehydrogenase